MRTTRLLALTAAFMAIMLIATNALLMIHLQAQTTCADCHHETGHDHDKCRICQVLLGPAGKYLRITQADIGFIGQQPPIACDIQSQIIEQHTPGVADARGPPSC